MSVTIEEAINFYNKRELRSLAKALQELENGTPNKEVTLLRIKFDALCLDFYNEEKKNHFVTEVATALSEAENLKEYFEINNGYEEALLDRYYVAYQTKVDSLVQAPNINALTDRANLTVKYTEIPLLIMFAAKEIKKDYLKELLKTEGYSSMSEAEKVYDKSISKDDAFIDHMDYEGGCKLFETLSARFDDETGGAPEIVKNNLPKLMTAYYTAENLLGSPKEKNSLEIYKKSQAALAKLYTFGLNAVCHPNGRMVSFLLGNGRKAHTDRLNAVYKELHRLDPDFPLQEVPYDNGYQGGSSGSSGGGGCYVATAIYGSYDCPEVWTLRRFRDNTLAKTWYGRAFIHTYYAISPTIVKLFGKTDWFKNLWKPLLDKIVKDLQANGVENTTYNDKEW